MKTFWEKGAFAFENSESIIELNLTPEEKMKCSNFVIHSQRKRTARHQVCHSFRFIFKRISTAKVVLLV
jgi:hypothetical protein